VTLWILDTDHVSLFQHGHSNIHKRINEVNSEKIAVTIITFEEQVRGRFNIIRQAESLDKLVTAYSRLQATLIYFNNINLIPFNQDAVNKYLAFLNQRIRIGTQDLKIAAIAMANNAILVTRNHRDFSRIPGLELEDWSH
jgi:tRNA(fMet)-specific endonuclease VapC